MSSVAPVPDEKPERPVAETGQIVIDLPKGEWALLRDPETVVNRDRKAVISAFESTKGGDVSKGMGAVDKLIALFVLGWSLPEPLPRDNPHSLDVLPVRTYDTLADQISIHAKEVFPDFTPSDNLGSPS